MTVGEALEYFAEFGESLRSQGEELAERMEEYGDGDETAEGVFAELKIALRNMYEEAKRLRFEC